MESLWLDMKYGARMLRRNPGFTLIAVLALALGIGSTTSIFTVVYGVLLRPLPYTEPERLVLIFEGIPGARSGPIGFSPPDFAFLERQQTRSFEGVAAFSNKTYELSGIREALRITGARVSPQLFPLLGVQAATGRTFTQEENVPGRNVVVLGHNLWMREFGGDSGILGRPITLDRQPYTIVGIMPQHFEFPSRGPASNNQPADIFVPLALRPNELQAWTSMYNHSVLARLKAGVTLEQARAEMSAMAKRIEEAYPAAARLRLECTVQPLQEEVVGRTETMLLVLLAAVGMVLLIGCADVANLLLTRVGERSREMAVRTAMGAGKLRLIRQLLSESLLLSLLGGGTGLLLSIWGTRLLLKLSPVSLPRTHEIQLDSSMIAFTILVSLATAALFGIMPALEASRGEVGEALKEGGRNLSPGRRRSRLMGLFVASQFALAVVLLIAAGLLMRSFFRLLATESGFRTENVVSMSLSLPAANYSSAVQIRSFYQTLLERIESLPGVKAVSAATDLPLTVRERRGFTPEVASASTVGEPRVVAHVWVLGDYFDALGIRLKSGRFFTRSDGTTGERVVMVNETMARRFWPGEDAVGKRICWGNSRIWMTIVGVIVDVKQGPLHTGTIPQTLEPYLQVNPSWIEDNVVGVFRSLTLIIRTDRNPATIMPAVRNEIRALDAALPIANVKTLEQHVQASVATQRFNTYLLGVFAVLALTLATIGIYGVMSRSVTQRTHEIGVRMALGARPEDVFKMIVGRGMLLALPGMAAGIAGAFALTRVLSSLLFGISPTDPVTFIAVPLLLAAVALLATYIPARRAIRVDPMIALRYE